MCPFELRNSIFVVRELVCAGRADQECVKEANQEFHSPAYGLFGILAVRPRCNPGQEVRHVPRGRHSMAEDRDEDENANECRADDLPQGLQVRAIAYL